MKLNLTKASVDAMTLPESGKTFYYDTKLQGFGVYCTKTGKTYFAEKRVNGKIVRTTIGKHGIFFPDRARDEARELLVRMSKGENPNETSKIESATLKDAVEVYIKQRTSGQGRQIKAKTVEGYQWILNGPLKPWHAYQMHTLDETKVREIHKDLTDNRGPTTANHAIRLLRATFNFEGVVPNPVDVLSKKALWNKEKRRTGFIDSGNVSTWIKNAEKLSLEMRGAILMMLFLGLRKMEALGLKKSQIRNQAVYLDEGSTKNSDGHMVPIGPYLWERIEPLMKIEGEWLFPARRSKTGHIHDPRKSIATLGLKVTPHDLRRTFVSHLNALEPAPSAYTIKRLMNHRMDSSDVTAGYIQIEEKKLREVITRLEESMVGKTETNQECPSSGNTQDDRT